MPVTKCLSIDKESPEKEKIEKAAEIIDKGGLVAFPTETVYGIACSWTNEKGKQRLYQIKNRPKTKPFTVHIADVQTIRALDCHVDNKAEKLIERFWPGPLTIILNKNNSLQSIGFRMPENEIALQLIKACNSGVVAPSANLSGEKPPVCVKDVLDQLDGQIDLIIDGGITTYSKESTIVDLTKEEIVILRQGAIAKEDIMQQCHKER